MARRLNLRGVHVFAKVPGQNRFVLKETNPIIKLSQDGQDVYIQGGSVYSGGGDPIAKADLPAWFDEAVAKLNPVALAEAGWKQPTEAKKGK